MTSIAQSPAVARSAALSPVSEQLPQDVFGSPEKESPPPLSLNRSASSPSRKRPREVLEEDEDSDEDMADPQDSASSDEEAQSSDYTTMVLSDKISLVRQELASLLPEELPPPPQEI